MKKASLSILFLVLSVTIALAQNTKPFILGTTEEIRSSSLSESRTLNVYLPEGYDQHSISGYPVIYLLDGSANEDFIHIVGLVQFFNMIGSLPKSIVVGISNVDRKRDFTYPTTIAKDKKDYPTTGGSDKFTDFLEKEVQPYIQQKYKTNNVKTVIGQSLGGLLATEILLKRPNLFNNYIIVSPSLWWDNESLLVQAPLLLKSFSDRSINVCLTVGTEGTIMENDAAKLAQLLKGSGYENLKINFFPLPAESHLTILNRGVYKAFEVLSPKK